MAASKIQRWIKNKQITKMKELIKLWREFEEETKEKRKMNYYLEEKNRYPKYRYFKADFSDFIDWLENGNLEKQN